MTATENTYKTSLINNRRYLGNKYKLLPFITSVVDKECDDIKTVADIFAGTGAVSSAFADKTLITNDLMYSNYICNYAWFGAEGYDSQKVIDYVVRYCAKIGYIREDIERNYKKGNLNNRERAILITSLLYAMDKIAVTCGHYDAYRKGAKFEGSLELYVPLVEVNNNSHNQCFNEDANNLVKRIEADLVYIDPPYNSRQYCDSYHLLENVARWEKPDVFGVAKKMDRSGMKSKYCTIAATKAFETLINDIKAKYILLSYNNMAEKGNCRSNAKISDNDIMRILSQKGTVKVFEESYNRKIGYSRKCRKAVFVYLL